MHHQFRQPENRLDREPALSDLTAIQQERLQSLESFANSFITPYADKWDQEQATPPSIIKQIGQEGLFSAPLPKPYGSAWDALSLGFMYESIGAASASLLSLLVVQSMVGSALARWGTERQKETWLPLIAKGEAVGAFALTEPNIGCDASNTQAKLENTGGNFLLNGTKTWISYGNVADVYLVFCKLEGQSTVCLVDRNQPGVKVTPLFGMLGFRSAHLATLEFNEVAVSSESIVSRPGFGFSHVGGSALDLGRFGCAWGAAGICGAAMQASRKYAASRMQFGIPLSDHPLMQGLIADMAADWRAARALCVEAARDRESNAISSITTTTMAKYVASRAAMKVTASAVQTFGAAGCHDSHPVARYYRDAKIFEIIEGSNQMQQLMIARHYTKGRKNFQALLPN